jgi:hypothetical protein
VAASRKTAAPVDEEFHYSNRAVDGERARQTTVAVTQTFLGLVLVLLGLWIVVPIVWSIVMFFVHGMRGTPGGSFLATVSFIAVFYVIGLIAGVLVVWGGVRLIRGAWVQGASPTGVKALARLSFDAVPVVGFVVGTGTVTNQVVVSFEPDIEVRAVLERLAEELSDPDILSELVGDKPYVANRRKRIPKELTDGHVVYLADLVVKHVVVKGEVKRRSAIPCVAEPGAGGRITATQ